VAWRILRARHLKILAASDSVRRAREALSFSAARLPFSNVVPQVARCDLATPRQLIEAFAKGFAERNFVSAAETQSDWSE